MMTLGDLIEVLKSVKDKKKLVLIGPGYNPNGFTTWRGDYYDLALNYTASGDPVTVKQLLAQARKANGSTFVGYKGGDYVMHLGTRIWIDNFGECHDEPLTNCIEDSESLHLFGKPRTVLTKSQYQEIAKSFGQDASTIREIHRAILSA